MATNTKYSKAETTRASEMMSNNNAVSDRFEEIHFYDENGQWQSRNSFLKANLEDEIALADAIVARGWRASYTIGKVEKVIEARPVKVYA